MRGTVCPPPGTGTGTGTGPEIEVSGDGISITDGDTTPFTNDGTDFGTVIVGGTAVTRTFTVTNTGQAPLTLGAPQLPEGYAIGDDSLVTSLAPGARDTFTVALNPNSPIGVRLGTITISNNDGNEGMFTFDVAGRISGKVPIAIQQSVRVDEVIRTYALTGYVFLEPDVEFGNEPSFKLDGHVHLRRNWDNSSKDEFNYLWNRHLEPYMSWYPGAPTGEDAEGRLWYFPNLSGLLTETGPRYSDHPDHGLNDYLEFEMFVKVDDAPVPIPNNTVSVTTWHPVGSPDGPAEANSLARVYHTAGSDLGSLQLFSDSHQTLRLRLEYADRMGGGGKQFEALVSITVGNGFSLGDVTVTFQKGN